MHRLEVDVGVGISRDIMFGAGSAALLIVLLLYMGTRLGVTCTQSSYVS